MNEIWTPEYDSWRHGGWYVSNVRYPGGACGCVSRNFADKKWRIVCGTGHLDDHTFPNRDAAARAERLLSLALAETCEGRAKEAAEQARQRRIRAGR